jgi:hypothetical protein
MMLPMQTIAAYYVMIANDLARERSKPRYAIVPDRPSLSARIAAALAGRGRSVRPAASQPA